MSPWPYWQPLWLAKENPIIWLDNIYLASVRYRFGTDDGLANRTLNMLETTELDRGAFRVEGLVATVTIKRTMLQDTTKALAVASSREANVFGFALGGLITNPVLVETQFLRTSFFISDMTEDDVTLHVGQSILKSVGFALKASTNTAVARMGFELLRIFRELPKLQEN